MRTKQLSLALGVFLAFPALASAEISPADKARASIAANAERLRKAPIGTLASRTLSEPEVRAEATKSLSTEAIERAMRQHRVEIQGCYDRALGATAKRLAGSVKFELQLEPSGAVRAVGVTSGEKPGELERCLQRTVKRWRFPATEAPTNLSYVFVFSRDAG